MSDCCQNLCCHRSFTTTMELKTNKTKCNIEYQKLLDQCSSNTKNYFLNHKLNSFVMSDDLQHKFLKCVSTVSRT